MKKLHKIIASTISIAISSGMITMAKEEGNTDYI